MIDHPAGAETQWDWVELPDPPPDWGWGREAHLLVGALSHSSRWLGVLCESADEAHLIDGIDRVTRAFGGVSRAWRVDRMATVCHPAAGTPASVRPPTGRPRWRPWPPAAVPCAPFPAEIRVARTVSPQALVAYAGNFYSVASELGARDDTR